MNIPVSYSHIFPTRIVYLKFTVNLKKAEKLVEISSD